ncbi:hypothetical protein B0I37DRAFT_355203 [Chaetomium sp. MPI-CAGE-AT-0009]|nr:hypothetical protein B0I37DRAFT_355203 [Chaetomium sp. MPI-CAGE-AT-0009]
MPRRVTNRDRPHPSGGSRRSALTDSLEGMIMWLPLRKDLPRHVHSELPDGCYGHPVVILSPQASLPGHQVVVLIVTSFGETDVRDKFPHDIELRRVYLPIHPARNRNTKIQLRLQDGAKLRKKSYANTRQQRTIPLAFLQPYDRNELPARYVLTSDSYKKLARRAGFVLDAAEPSEDAHTTDYTARTLAVLADSTREERLSLEPITHSTMPVSGVSPPPAPLPPSPRLHRNENTLPTRPHIQEYHYTITQPARQHTLPAARPYQSREALLPRYEPRQPAHYSYTSGGESGSNVAGCLSELTPNRVLLALVVLALMALGLLWLWMGCVGRGSDCSGL